MFTLTRLPAVVRNPLSLLGVTLATAMAVLFLALFLLEAFGYLDNPYFGLLLFVAVPAMFIGGLLLIPAGAWWWTRRRRSHPELREWPVIDLRVPRQRAAAAAIVVLTPVNLVIVSLATYGGVHYMDSSAFCGQVCHTTMEPQYAAHTEWPHARVACTGCHVGPGAGAAIEAKLAGTRQLFHVVTNRVPRPIPPPSTRTRPARDTCQQCHWPDTLHGDRPRIVREYASDEANSESVTRLTLHTGSGRDGTGIHWHASPDTRVEYVADAATPETIPYVRLTDRRGNVREFLAEGVARARIDNTALRRMDCADCHNRAAHTFHATPGRAIDAALARGRIPRELPFVRREAVSAISADYPDRATAFDAIARRLVDFYAARGGTDPRLVERAATAAQDVWSRNVFPAMRVAWGTYPNHIGHVDSPGCFRCHDDSHTAADGTVIRQDCELCHTAPE